MNTKDHAIEAVAPTIGDSVAAGTVKVDIVTAFAQQLNASVQELHSRALVCYLGDHEQQYDSLMFSVHSTYSTVGNHNCLGCNFHDLVKQIHDYLSMVNDSGKVAKDSIHHVYSIYFLLLNSIWERIDDIYKLLGVPKAYKEEKFRALMQARKWANFFKHPGSFAYAVHHPAHTIAGTDDFKDHTYKNQLDLSDSHAKMLYVNSKFVWDNYSADEEKCTLKKQYRKHSASTVIVFPNLHETNKDICSCLEHFVELITKNPIYVSIIKDQSTL